MVMVFETLIINHLAKETIRRCLETITVTLLVGNNDCIHLALGGLK
jgi:hypothetical protein